MNSEVSTEPTLAFFPSFVLSRLAQKTLKRFLIDYLQNNKRQDYTELGYTYNPLQGLYFGIRWLLFVSSSIICTPDNII